MKKQIKICESTKEVFLKAVEKLNRKARKYGMNEIVATLTGTGLETRKVYKHDEGSIDCEVAVLYYELNEDFFRLGDWEFAGTVDYLEKSILISQNPTLKEEIPSRFRSMEMKGKCEHCNTNRFRVNIFIVRNTKTNEFKQVGRSCLTDYCNGWSLRDFEFRNVVVQKLFGDLDDGFFGGELRSNDRGVPTEYVVAMAYAACKINGWVSTKHANDFQKCSTADEVRYQMDKPKAKDIIAVSDEDIKKAAAAIKWAANLKDNNNDFLTKIGQLAREEYIAWKHISLTVAITVAYDKQIQHDETVRVEKKRKAAAEDVASGKGVAITGTVVSLRWKETDFGGSLKMIVLDDRGFKVWGSVPTSLEWVCESTPSIKVKDLDFATTADTWEEDGINFRNLKEGDKVTFIANVDMSDTDTKFGFFKRPRKAQYIAA